MLDRAREVGMRFNPDKYIFKQDSISFYGITLSKDGVKPDPRKIQAIRQLPEPKTEVLLVFLGYSQLSVEVQPKHSQDDHQLVCFVKEGQ